jgi:hypothetical protein
MSVTSITSAGVSFRTLPTNTSHASAPARKRPQTIASDSVELSQQAVAEARSADPSMRAETLLKTCDTDGDGVVTRMEFRTGAVERLKRPIPEV